MESRLVGHDFATNNKEFIALYPSEVPLFFKHHPPQAPTPLISMSFLTWSWQLYLIPTQPAYLYLPFCRKVSFSPHTPPNRLCLEKTWYSFVVQATEP